MKKRATKKLAKRTLLVPVQIFRAKGIPLEQSYRFMRMSAHDMARRKREKVYTKSAWDVIVRMKELEKAGKINGKA